MKTPIAVSKSSPVISNYSGRDGSKFLINLFSFTTFIQRKSKYSNSYVPENFINRSASANGRMSSPTNEYGSNFLKRECFISPKDSTVPSPRPSACQETPTRSSRKLFSKFFFVKILIT
jgi:hypothetical protein